MKTIAWALRYKCAPGYKQADQWLTHKGSLDFNILSAKLFDVPELALEADEDMEWVKGFLPAEAVPILIQELSPVQFHINPS